MSWKNRQLKNRPVKVCNARYTFNKVLEIFYFLLLLKNRKYTNIDLPKFPLEYYNPVPRNMQNLDKVVWHRSKFVGWKGNIFEAS